jgi:polygalacturonase
VLAVKYKTSFACIGLIAGFLCSSACIAGDDESGWSAVPEIIASIKEPQFGHRDFAISDYGAKSGGNSDCGPAFAKAIAACNKAAGGRVLVPEGDWFVRGPIHLKTGVNLHVAQNATVRFSTDPSDYLPVVHTRFEGNELMNYSPLIYADDQNHIAVTGSGTLDGQAAKDNWWEWKGSGKKDSESLRHMGDRDAPLEQRAFGDGHRLRPNFLQFYNCHDVLVEGITVTNSPMWLLHPVLCTNVTIRGVMLTSHGPNNDGCDPESCRDVLIEKCTFDTGDDCIAIKAGRGGDGRRSGVPSENIVVRDCQMKDGHGGVVLGSEMSAGIRNVFVENCQMGSPNLVRAIRLKSNSSRGGYLENLFVRNIHVDQVKEAVVRINLQYEKDRGDQLPTVRNIEIANIDAEKCKRPFYFVGLPNAKISNVVITDCTFHNASQPSVFENIDDVHLHNFRLLPREALDND